MNAKDLLLKDKETAAWWNSAMKTDKWEKVKSLARAEMVEQGWNHSELSGANNLLELMTTFAEKEAESLPMPSAGLKHDLNPVKRTTPEP